METHIPLRDGLDRKLQDFGLRELHNVDKVVKCWEEFFRHDMSDLEILTPVQISLLYTHYCGSLGSLSKNISFSGYQFVSFLKVEWKHLESQGLNLYMNQTPDKFHISDKTTMGGRCPLFDPKFYSFIRIELKI